MGSFVGQYVVIKYSARVVLDTPRIGRIVGSYGNGYHDVEFAGGVMRLVSIREMDPMPPRILPIRKVVVRG